mmetsp:Transcript_20308/g.30148  ORF Transcript_20308/g.30148 Transcript_20308/m.30148 type:complete len:323 (-) Transcript_20308:151-1119(-)
MFWYFRWQVEDGFEVDITFGIEMCPSRTIGVGFFGKNLPKFLIFVGCDFVLVSCPNGWRRIDFFPFVRCDFFCLFGFFFWFTVAVVVGGSRLLFLSHFKIVSFLLFFFFFFFGCFVIVVVFNFNGRSYNLTQSDWMSNKFRVVSNQFFEFSIVGIFCCIFLQMKCNFSSASQGIATGIFKDMIGGLSIGGFPNVLLFGIRMFGCNRNAIRNEECGIEANTKSSNHSSNIRTLILISKCLQELGSTRTSNRTKILNEVVLGHPDTSVPNGQSVGISIIFHLHFHFWFFFQNLLVLERNESSLIQCITCIRNQFTQKDVLVRVQ